MAENVLVFVSIKDICDKVPAFRNYLMDYPVSIEVSKESIDTHSNELLAINLIMNKWENYQLGELDFYGGIMDAFPEDGITPGRDFEGAPNLPHISEYMDYFNTLSPREVQGLGSIFKKMYIDKAIDEKLFNFYNA